MRRYCDQVGFEAGKELRDTLNRIQRQLRDHYTAAAAELERSHAEALERASEAVRRDEAERARRLADVDAELQRLVRLRQQALALVPSAATAGGEAVGP